MPSTDPTEADLKAVKDYFGFLSNSQFLEEWKQLSDQEKHEIRVLVKEVLSA